MDFILVPTVVGIITLGIYKLFELFVRRKERLTIIEKMGNNFNADLLPGHDISVSNTSKPYSTLKVACLLLGIGLGLLTGFLILILGVNEALMDNSGAAREIKSVVYGASVLLFGGLGLLIAFILEQRFEEKKQQ